MITLEVEEYCHGCEDFTPELQTIYADNKAVKQTVYCLLGARCRRIRDRLKEKAAEEMKAEARE